MTSRFLTGCSSSVGLADSEIVISHGAFIQHIVVSRLAQTVCSQQAFLKLTNALIDFAEQAYMLRDVDALAEVSRVLMSLPIDGARQIGLYYHALGIKRRGQINEAEGLLETVVDNAPPAYRARAIQGLGAVHHDLGQLDEALRFQIEALHAASDRNECGLQTTLLARWEISIIRGLDGNHKGALSDLKNLRPLVNLAAKQKPFYYYAYANALAVELGELGRITEAQAALDVALASPYAPAYPDWIETRDEIATNLVSATPSVVAVKRAPEAAPSPQPERERKPKRAGRLNFSSLSFNKTTLQRGSKTIAVTVAIFNGGTTHSILERVLNCSGPRAPPACT